MILLNNSIFNFKSSACNFIAFNINELKFYYNIWLISGKISSFARCQFDKFKFGSFYNIYYSACSSIPISTEPSLTTTYKISLNKSTTFSMFAI